MRHIFLLFTIFILYNCGSNPTGETNIKRKGDQKDDNELWKIAKSEIIKEGIITPSDIEKIKDFDAFQSYIYNSKNDNLGDLTRLNDRLDRKYYTLKHDNKEKKSSKNELALLKALSYIEQGRLKILAKKELESTILEPTKIENSETRVLGKLIDNIPNKDKDDIIDLFDRNDITVLQNIFNDLKAFGNFLSKEKFVSYEEDLALFDKDPTNIREFYTFFENLNLNVFNNICHTTFPGTIFEILHTNFSLQTKLSILKDTFYFKNEFYNRNYFSGSVSENIENLKEKWQKTTFKYTIDNPLKFKIAQNEQTKIADQQAGFKYSDKNKINALKEFFSTKTPLDESEKNEIKGLLTKIGINDKDILKIENLKSASVGKTIKIIYRVDGGKEKSLVIKMIKPNLTNESLDLEKEDLISMLTDIREGKNEQQNIIDITEKIKDEINLNIERENILRAQKIYNNKSKNIRTVNLHDFDKKISVVDELKTKFLILENIEGADLSTIFKFLKEEKLNADFLPKIKDNISELTNIYCRQLLADDTQYYHNDLHSGNIMVDTKENDLNFVLIDYGKIGKMFNKQKNITDKDMKQFIACLFLLQDEIKNTEFQGYDDKKKSKYASIFSNIINNIIIRSTNNITDIFSLPYLMTEHEIYKTYLKYVLPPRIRDLDIKEITDIHQSITKIDSLEYVLVNTFEAKNLTLGADILSKAKEILSNLPNIDFENENRLLEEIFIEFKLYEYRSTELKKLIKKFNSGEKIFKWDYRLDLSDLYEFIKKYDKNELKAVRCFPIIQNFLKELFNLATLNLQKITDFDLEFYKKNFDYSDYSLNTDYEKARTIFEKAFKIKEEFLNEGILSL